MLVDAAPEFVLTFQREKFPNSAGAAPGSRQATRRGPENERALSQKN